MSTDARVTRDLVETLHDGRKGFATAAEKLAESDRPDLSAKMTEYSNQRAAFAAELEALAATYGDDIDEDGSVAAAVHRSWMAVKDALSGSSPEGVLDAAEQGEDHAVSELRGRAVQGPRGAAAGCGRAPVHRHQARARRREVDARSHQLISGHRDRDRDAVDPSPAGSDRDGSVTAGC